MTNEHPAADPVVRAMGDQPPPADEPAEEVEADASAAEEPDEPEAPPPADEPPAPDAAAV